MVFVSHSTSHFFHPTGSDTKQRQKRYNKRNVTVFARTKINSTVHLTFSNSDLFNFQTVSGVAGDGIDPTNYEVVTDNLEVGISIKNITKIFGLVSYCLLHVHVPTMLVLGNNNIHIHCNVLHWQCGLIL